MIRLPRPGTDNGVWGDMLNEYLLVAHNEDGTLKQDGIAAAIAATTLPQSQISGLTAALNSKADNSALAQVATSGSYTDLTSKPTIPTTASDVNAVASDELDQEVSQTIVDTNSSTRSALNTTYALKSEVPTGIVTSPGVSRIITSTNPNEPLEDGDLLIVIPTGEVVDAPSFFTDFSQYTTGSQPSDWTQRWVSATWTVVDDPTATGGKILRQTASSDARRALSWDAVDATGNQRADAEIVFKWRSVLGAAPARAALRCTGVASGETGYYGAVRNNTSRALGRYLSGASTLPFGAEAAGSISSNTWYITRFRVNGTSIMAKTWAATDSEPTSWELSANDSSITGAGYVQLVSFGNQQKDYDWVGVAVNGGTAPMEAP